MQSPGRCTEQTTCVPLPPEMKRSPGWIHSLSFLAKEWGIRAKTISYMEASRNKDKEGMRCNNKPWATKPIVPPQPRLGGALEPECQWAHKTRNDLKAIPRQDVCHRCRETAVTISITWTCFTALPVLTFRQQEQGACRLATNISRGTFHDKRRWSNTESLEGAGAEPKDSTPNHTVSPTQRQLFPQTQEASLMQEA